MTELLLVGVLVVVFGVFQVAVRGVEMILAKCDSIFDKGGDASLCAWSR